MFTVQRIYAYQPDSKQTASIRAAFIKKFSLRRFG